MCGLCELEKGEGLRAVQGREAEDCPRKRGWGLSKEEMLRTVQRRDTEDCPRERYWGLSKGEMLRIVQGEGPRTVQGGQAENWQQRGRLGGGLLVTRGRKCISFYQPFLLSLRPCLPELQGSKYKFRKLTKHWSFPVIIYSLFTFGLTYMTRQKAILSRIVCVLSCSDGLAGDLPTLCVKSQQIPAVRQK